MARNIFISLNSRDADLAQALQRALDDVFGGALEVNCSTSEALESGIRSGEDWFQWIVRQVTECDKAFVLITPNSVQAPWLMWESGAVFGAAMSSGQSDYGKVWPIVFQLKSNEIPSPIRDSKAQRRYGDRPEDVKRMILELFDEYKTELKGDAFGKLANLNHVLDEYMIAVRDALLNAPALPTEMVLEEWRHRVSRLKEENRASEVKQLQHWMEISFGREEGKQPQSVDLGIHIQLGELYAANKEWQSAIAQFELARRLGPRDVLVLRQLGRFYLEARQMEDAKGIIERIRELDPSALERNVECAALLGRYYRQSGNLRKAVESFSAALSANPSSYYLANLSAEVYLELGDADNAREIFRTAIKIIDNKISDRNIWTVATKMNAYTALGDIEKAREELASLVDFSPTRDQLQSIARGLAGIAEQLEPKPDIQPLLAKLS